MGMKIDRALKLRDSAVSAWHSLGSTAYICGLTHTDVMRRSDEIDATLKGAPSWAKAYVHGYSAHLRDSWYESGALVWAHVAPDGTRYTADKVTPAWGLPVDPLYKAGRGAEIATWKHGHFWRTSGKPYSDISSRNSDKGV